MSVKVDFLKNISDNRRLEKSLSTLKSQVECDIYTPCDIINPILIISMTNVDLVDTNYCYITEFGRYYYITKIEPQSAGMCYIYCHVDVLMTYKNEIRNCPIIAARSTNNYNLHLQDDMRIFNSKTKSQYIDFMDIGEPNTIILITQSGTYPIPPTE